MRSFSLIAVLLVSACGFSPVYGTNSVNNETQAQNTRVKFALNDINIAAIPNREGQYLRNALVDRFYFNGTPSKARYNLVIDPIKERTYNFDITRDSEATRRQLELTTHMQLIDTHSGKTILKRPLNSIASYNVLSSEFSTLVTEQNARDDALNDFSRQIEREVALYFKR